MRSPTRLGADEKHGSEAQMLRIVSDLETMVRSGAVVALSVVLIDSEGRVNHDQSYPVEDGSIVWLALAGAHGFAADSLRGDAIDGWLGLNGDEGDDVD